MSGWRLWRLKRHWSLSCWRNQPRWKKIKSCGRIGIHWGLVWRIYVANCATEVASLLTRYGNRYADGKADDSFLVKSLLQVTRGDHDEEIGKDVSPLIQFVESLSWFWEFVYSAETIENPNVGPRFLSITNSVHKQATNPLLVPIASCICSLLGAVGHGPSSEASKCCLSLPPSAESDDEDPF